MLKGLKHKIAACMAVIMLVCSMPLLVYATSTQDKLGQTQQEKEELEREQQENQEKLDSLEKNQNSLMEELTKLNEELTAVSSNLESLEKQIVDKEQEIVVTTAALEEAQVKEERQYMGLQSQIQFMYEQEDHMYMESLLSATSFADFINFNEYFEQITTYGQDLLDEYEANRIYIEEEEARLVTEKLELDNLKLAAEAEKSKVAGLISQTAKNIEKYAASIDDAEKAALEIEAGIKKKEEDIVYLKQKIAEEKALSQAAANAAWREISEVTFAEGDRYLLANIIYCEAGGEPYAGQLAVGAVVINRVLSSKYPATVSGVIYQNKQFSPVGSGRLSLALATNKATASCYRAADEAMSGITNVGGCLYFRTPIDGLTGISIGGHIFY